MTSGADRDSQEHRNTEPTPAVRGRRGRRLILLIFVAAIAVIAIVWIVLYQAAR